MEFANARNYIQLNGLEVPTDFSDFAGATPPPPNVHGVVMDARKSKKQRGVEYVEISIGSDDGLLEGHSLYVFRSAVDNKGKAKFLGRIEIVLLTPDRAVGTVVGKAKNGVIQKGDNVTTRL